MSLSLEDRVSIHELLARYGRACDNSSYNKPGSTEAWLALFTEDATFVDPTTSKKIREKTESRHPGRGHEQHLLYNIVVDGDGDEANVQATMYVVAIPPDAKSSEVIFIGDYDKFRVRKMSDTWKIAEIEIKSNIALDLVPRFHD